MLIDHGGLHGTYATINLITHRWGKTKLTMSTICGITTSTLVISTGAKTQSDSVKTGLFKSNQIKPEQVGFQLITRSNL